MGGQHTVKHSSGGPHATRNSVPRAESARVEEVEPFPQRVQALFLGVFSREYLFFLFLALRDDRTEGHVSG